MAVQPASGVWISRGVHQKTWNAHANGDTGAPLNAPLLIERTISVSGTWGVGGSIQIEGNNDNGADWNILQDLQGNPIVLNANGTITFQSGAAYIRTNCTNGDGTTALVPIITSTKR